MNPNDDLLKQIQGMLNKKSIGLNILEAQIDVDKQVEYFDYVKKIKEEYNEEENKVNHDDLFDPEKSIDEKKHALCLLAKQEDVSAFRTIEKYLEAPDEELKEWAQLAYNEGRMILESALLDESQIFISTGLGGKGQNLRYFVVLISNNGESLSNLHQNIIKKEFEFSLSKHKGELETLEFMDIYATITCIVPINVPLYQVLREAVDESNQIGDFLQENFIVTNVKKFTLQEIDEFVAKNIKNEDGNDDKDTMKQIED